MRPFSMPLFTGVPKVITCICLSPLPTSLIYLMSCQNDTASQAYFVYFFEVSRKSRVNRWVQHREFSKRGRCKPTGLCDAPLARASLDPLQTSVLRCPQSSSKSWPCLDG